ncbi:MAG: hypothetical protein ACLSA6_00180 [Holdemania massiliensis]
MSNKRYFIPAPPSWKGLCDPALFARSDCQSDDQKSCEDPDFPSIFDSAENLEHIVYTDVKWIDFILGQIVTNAVKYRILKNQSAV